MNHRFVFAYKKSNHLKKLLFTSLVIIFFTGFSLAQNEPFSVRVVNPAYQLNSGWEITYGPDDSLWVTENFAYKVDRINIANGGKSELIDLSSKKDFTSPPKWPQGGLMGMVLHPAMYSEWPNPSKPYVYLAYVYNYAPTSGCSGGSGACFFKTKIVRYNYNRVSHTLTNEQVITNTLNGSNDHNSGRLAIGKIAGISYLFYTIGDMGAGQFNNISRTNNAQTRDTLEGKILRFNLEPDGDAGALDKWIPNDNPYTDASSKVTAVWSWGHRNAQGIVFGSNGKLYQSEHQDKSDDEINIIEEGRNYGWPKLSGYCDGNYNGLKLANQTVISEQLNCAALSSKDPLYTLFTDPSPGTLGSGYLTWPTVAPSSIDIYEQNQIPFWNESLLVPTLKAGKIYRLKLNVDGTIITDTSSIVASRGIGRYRDICISPDGRRLYAVCDITGQTSGPTGSYNGGSTPPPNAGRILEFSYAGTVLSINADPVKDIQQPNTIIISPNPSPGMLHISTPNQITKPIYYTVHDLNGHLLLQGKSFHNIFQVDLHDMPAGVYVLQLNNAYKMKIVTKKIIKY